MNNNRGIFENLPNKPSTSPFSVVQDPAAPSSPFSAAPQSPSPFTPAPKQSSPFAAATDIPAPKTGKLPDRRKSDSPFQVSDASEGFGFEASPSPFAAAPPSSPFSAAPSEPAPSPFSAVPNAEISAPASPFAISPAEPVSRSSSPFS